MSVHTFQALLPFCSTRQPPAVASEAANAALNLAYEVGRRLSLDPWPARHALQQAWGSRSRCERRAHRAGLPPGQPPAAPPPPPQAANVAHLVRCKGEAALLQLLAAGVEEALANAAGALQTVCFQREGRDAVRRAGGVGVLLRLLQRGGGGLEAKARQRAVGALHNLTAEAEAVAAVREQVGGRVEYAARRRPPGKATRNSGGAPLGAVPGQGMMPCPDRLCTVRPPAQGGITVLAGLLRSADAGTAAAAVGALSNVSREAASCQVRRAGQRDLFWAAACSCVSLPCWTTGPPPGAPGSASCQQRLWL